MLCLFLFHIDYTIKPCFHKKTTMSDKRYITHYKLLSDLDTVGFDSIFAKNVYTWRKSSVWHILSNK